MTAVKLKNVLDGDTFVISKRTKVEYTLASKGISKKNKKGILVTAVLSNKSFVYKPGKVVYISE